MEGKNAEAVGKVVAEKGGTSRVGRRGCSNAPGSQSASGLHAEKRIENQPRRERWACIAERS